MTHRTADSSARRRLMRSRTFLAVTMGLDIAASVSAAGDFFHFHKKSCDTCQPDCGCPTCRLKPVTTEVKKPVYSVKCVPYCQSRACLLCGLCDRKCDHVRYRRVLMKTEKVVDQKCELKCVLEGVSAGKAAPTPAEPPLPPVPLPPTEAPRRSAFEHPPDDVR